MANLKIHKDGYIIGGNHHRGLAYRASCRRIMKSYIQEQFDCGNLVIKKLSTNKISYKIKRQPKVARGSLVNELNAYRAQHFLRDFENASTNITTLMRQLHKDTERLVDHFKN